MVPFERLCTVSYSRSIVIMTLSRIVSEIKQDIGGKSRFFIPPAFNTSIRVINAGILP